MAVEFETVDVETKPSLTRKSMLQGSHTARTLTLSPESSTANDGLCTSTSN